MKFLEGDLDGRHRFIAHLLLCRIYPFILNSAVGKTRMATITPLPELAGRYFRVWVGEIFRKFGAKCAPGVEGWSTVPQ